MLNFWFEKYYALGLGIGEDVSDLVLGASTIAVLKDNTMGMKRDYYGWSIPVRIVPGKSWKRQFWGIQISEAIQLSRVGV